MTNFTVARSEDELYQIIDSKKSEGYLEDEITIISKTKLHLDDLHNSQITLIATSGSFSDRMSKMLTGEDGEQAVLSRYDLPENQFEDYKKEILEGNILVVTNRDNSSHKEVEENNSAYETTDITSYASESKGPKS